MFHLNENVNKTFDDFIEKQFSNKIITISSHEEFMKYISKILSTNEKFYYRGIDDWRNILPTLMRKVEIISKTKSYSCIKTNYYPFIVFFTV